MPKHKAIPFERPLLLRMPYNAEEGGSVCGLVQGSGFRVKGSSLSGAVLPTLRRLHESDTVTAAWPTLGGARPPHT